MAEQSALEKIIEKERARISKERETLLEQRKHVDDQLAALDRQLAAADAYEAALKGKAPRAAGGGKRGPRSGSMRQVLIDTIANSSGGLTRSELLEKMGVKSDDAKAQTISTSLSNLKKAGKLRQEGGKWIAAA